MVDNNHCSPLMVVKCDVSSVSDVTSSHKTLSNSLTVMQVMVAKISPLEIFTAKETHKVDRCMKTNAHTQTVNDVYPLTSDIMSRPIANVDKDWVTNCYMMSNNRVNAMGAV